MMKYILAMRTLLASAGLALLLALATEPSVSAQEAPAWMKQTLPDQALKPHWDEQLAVMNPTGAKPRTSLALLWQHKFHVHIAFTVTLNWQKPLVRPMLK